MYLSQLDDLRGLQKVPLPLDRQQHYQFTEEANSETVRALIDCLPVGYGISFFDDGHPQISDPGAYITLVRVSEGFVAMCGNHGWSSDWVALSDREAKRYLELCIPYSVQYQESFSLYESDLCATQNYNMAFPESRFRKYLDERLRI